MIPPVSPYGLIQESLWPNEWRCLVTCMLLNCTSRKQVEKIVDTFFEKWPNPNSFLDANEQEVFNLISPLGFKNKRTQNLFKMTKMYSMGDWKHVSELPGIGDYASRAWEIFFLNKLGNHPPIDGALMVYWHWRKKHGY